MNTKKVNIVIVFIDFYLKKSKCVLLMISVSEKPMDTFSIAQPSWEVSLGLTIIGAIIISE